MAGGEYATRVEQSLDAIGLAQVKLGWANDKVAIYGTGGLAFGRLQTSTAVSVELATEQTIADFDMDDYVTGWTLGAAAEFMVTDSVSVGVSYNYVDFGSVSSSENVDSDFDYVESVVNVKGNVDAESEPYVHVVKASLYYHF